MTASLHAVSGTDYVVSTKKCDSSTNTVLSMICHWTSDTTKQSSCIDAHDTF